MRIVVILLAALMVTNVQVVCGQAADTLSLSERVIHATSFATGFRGEVWQNPALYYYYTPYTWTTIDVNAARHDKGRASLKQEGDEDTRIGVDVRSFVILSEQSRVFGSAGYNSRKQENVLWNENIDWELIAPYVTGDSIGGFLKGETYYFNGGYAGESGRWTWGITGAYRASHNYRDKDPRPRNTASDLSFSVGGGYLLGAYRLGVSADFRYYQQNCDISFLADKGSTSVYHVLGLGMDYARFAGNQTGTKYQGIQWKGSVGILPVDVEQGISAVVSMGHMAMDKRLSSANSLTLLKLGTTDVNGNVSWIHKPFRSSTLGMKLDAKYTVRKGTENLYGEAGGSSYGTLISTSPGIKITDCRVSAEGLWEKLPYGEQVWGGAIVPNITYHRWEADYKAVSRFVHLSALAGSLRVRLHYQINRLRLTAEANGGYYANLSAESALPGLDASKSSAQTLLANIDYLSDSYGWAEVRLQGDYPIKRYNLFLSLQWQGTYYKECGTARYAACSLGVFF